MNENIEPMAFIAPNGELRRNTEALNADEWGAKFEPLYPESCIRRQQSQIEELKADNFTLAQTVSELTTIRGSSTLVPDDKLKEMRERLAHLEKMVVWYQDITMTGTNSQDYENGFWDAVNFVKQHQLGTECGKN